jgi:predicted nuclease with TOPRIM domain
MKKDKETVEAQLQDYTAIKAKMQEVIQDKVGYKVKLEEQRERAEMLATENAGLKERITEVEEESKQFRKQIKQLNN